MIAFINGYMVEGSLEEIAKLLGIKLEDSSYAPTVTNTDHIPAQSCPPVFNPQWQSGQRELELGHEQSCPPDCASCWTQWQIDQRELELNKGKLVKGEENSGS